MDEWLSLPGFSVALEAGMRHMGSSEPLSSSLRPTALALIMVDHRTLLGSLATTPICSPSCSVHVDTPYVSLYRTLIKSLRMELAEGGSSRARGAKPKDISSIVPAEAMLQTLIRAVQCCVRHAHEVGGAHLYHGWEASSSSFSRSSGTTSHVSDTFQAWLRPQLILLRSWVLFWVECSDRSISREEFSAATAALVGMVASFREATLINADMVMMDLMLEACGFGRIGERRQGLHTPGSHALWEIFANQFLDGIPLPGRSNWGCTNLWGFSEAALPTKLCSGCRRVRYCSFRCQKTAWVEGEHSDVCGGGKCSPPACK